jgi:nucleotide-binding universal stress UspA family protein
MYRRMLIPLDGSKTAEKVLPYARSLARKHKIPVEFHPRGRTVEVHQELLAGAGTLSHDCLDGTVARIIGTDN